MFFLLIALILFWIWICNELDLHTLVLFGGIFVLFAWFCA